MWEICIETSINNKDYILYIKNKMQNTISAVSGVISLFENTDICSIAIGCKKQDKSKVAGVLRFILCDVICEKMKYDYLSKNVGLVPQDSGYFSPFVKVLTYFDSELERQIVMRSLNLTPKIVLESFLNFKLRPLKIKWQELCNLTNDNAGLFLQSETFLELLKFLIANLDVKRECIIVSMQDKCIVYEEKNKNLISLASFDKNDEFGLLSSLIELCPNHIKVMNSKNNKETTNILSNLFEGRVEIVKN